MRRLAAIFYDSWLVAAIILLGSALETFARSALGLGPDAPHYLLQAYVLIAPALFFGWFWTHGGQTLGMRAWRLRLLDESGRAVDWRQAMVRYLGAWLSLLAAGLGYVWVLVDRDGRAWHDRLSTTRLVLTRKGKD